MTSKKPNDKPPARVAVVGRGIAGLTAAWRLAEQGQRVTVWSAEDAPGAASAAAGAYWWPHAVEPADRVAGWAKTSWDVWAALAHAGFPGVGWTRHLRVWSRPDADDPTLRLVPEVETVDPSTLADLGGPIGRAIRATVPRIEVPVFLAAAEQHLRDAGVGFVVHRLSSLEELAGDYDLIVNASGLGARELVGDATLVALAGHALRVARPHGLVDSLRRVDEGPTFTLVLPREDDVVLGGTLERGRENLRPDPATLEAILQRCRAAVPALRDAPVLDAWVGLRPGRPEVRLEVERLPAGVPVIHDYGHGGAGFTVAWGCADEVVRWAGELRAPAAL